ncbi:MAG: hypothetical protein R2752_20795 [Vicinamibacterales bacterium]
MAVPRSIADILRRERAAVATALVVVLLGSVNWAQDPGRADRWLRAMLLLPGIILAAALWYAWGRRTGRTGDDPARQRYVHDALMLGVLAIGIRMITLFSLEIWVRYGDHAADLEAERRLLGLSTAAVFLVLGNAVPKILTPLSMLPLQLAERVTRARRVLGTTWVLLGLTLVVAYLAAPLALAQAAGRVAAGGGALSVVAAIVWMNAGPSGSDA